MQEKTLFSLNDDALQENIPLAERIRPKILSEVVGQSHLLGKNGFLNKTLSQGVISSMIFWGDPGTGKTTIARLLAQTVEDELHFEQISAIFSGVSDLKLIFAEAKKRRLEGGKTLLFIDEIHRFNKAQQDCLLPVIEDGTLTLIGATTENPSFSLTKALLSRMHILKFLPHNAHSLETLLERAESLQGRRLPVEEKAKRACIEIADGDARVFLGIIEEIWRANDSDTVFTLEEVAHLLQRHTMKYDRSGDAHYGLISALHKAIRGSDPQAALYYLARMLIAGEDPLYLCRRLARIATEDIGLADPQALLIVQAATENYRFLGAPEGELALAEACVYLATAPKSNAIYLAYKDALRDAKKHGSLSPPKHILNAPTDFMKQEGYGAGYIYDHDQKHGFSGQNYFPEALGRREYYKPVERGFEREVRKRLHWWDNLRQDIKDS